MPNVNAPYGLSPLLRSKVGGAAQANPYPKLSGVSTAIFENDVVALVSGGITPGGTPGTTVYLGVALNYGAASTATTHSVIDDPFQLFECQDDGTGSGTLLADLTKNVNLVFTAGDAALLRSKHQAATSTKATTSSLDLHIDSLLTTINNDFGQYARIVVQFNKHVKFNSQAGA